MRGTINPSKCPQGGGVRAGLTLTEVLVSLMLMAAAMAPILKALTQAHVSGRRMEPSSTSWMLAQSQVEELRARAPGQWDASWAQSSEPLEGGFYATITDSGPSSDLRTLRIQVGFDADGNGVLADSEVSADLSTLIARCD